MTSCTVLLPKPPVLTAQCSASRSQQSSANVTRSLSPLSQRNPNPSGQQRILAHDPVNTFGVDRRHTIKFCLSAKQSPYPTITIRGQFSDDIVYTEKHIRIISVLATSAILPVIGSSENDVQLRTRPPETTTDEAYSPSPGNKGACAIHFFARPYSTAS